MGLYWPIMTCLEMQDVMRTLIGFVMSGYDIIFVKNSLTNQPIKLK